MRNRPTSSTPSPVIAPFEKVSWSPSDADPPGDNCRNPPTALMETAARSFNPQMLAEVGRVCPQRAVRWFGAAPGALGTDAPYLPCNYALNSHPRASP